MLDPCRPHLPTATPFACMAVVLLGGMAPTGMAHAQEQPPPVRILFAGDVMLDGGPGHLISNGGDPFAAVAELLRDADLTIGNLECAIVKEGKAVDKPYTFKGPRSALPVLKKYFSAVSLANNHAVDWGKKGFLSELELLRDARLPWFGGGVDEKAARAPLVLTAAGRRIAFLGYNDFPPRSFAAGHSTPGVAWLTAERAVADVRAARAKADLVLVFLHWGEELEPLPNGEQQVLARQLIDAGADAIIGGHPHVTQTVEWYAGRPIVYSLGNFVFDYFPGDPPVWTGWLVRLTFKADGQPSLETFSVELDAAGVPHPVSRS